MYVVAVMRWGPPLEEELPALAARLGMVAYDLRLRLAGGLPVMFARVEDGVEAAEHVEFLRARGHGAVACDAEAVPGPDDQLVPIDFEFGAEAFHGTSTGGRRFELPYKEVLAMVHVACVTSAEETVTTQEKRFAPGRAVLSGGMVLRKKVDRVDKTVTQEQEQMIYMFCRSHPAPYVWKELMLRYEGLGDQRQLTAAQNFATLSKRLRSLAPHAFHDQRLLTHKRRADISLVAGSARERRLETSNAGENDLAAFLLVRGYLEGQL
jgi:hypothetical protein